MAIITKKYIKPILLALLWMLMAYVLFYNWLFIQFDAYFEHMNPLIRLAFYAGLIIVPTLLYLIKKHVHTHP